MSIFGDVDELTGGFADALGERLDSRPSRRGPTPLEAYLAKFRTTVPSWQALGSAQAAGAWAPTAPSWQSFGQRQDVGLWQPQAQGWQQAGDFFGQYRQAKGTREQAEQAAAGKSGTAVEAGDWSGPATADDNATLTPEAIDNYIRSQSPNSPLIGKGRAILDAANRNGVSAVLMVGIFGKESSYGSTAGPGYVLSGITDPSRDQGLGGQRAFQGFGSWEAAIDATARNLAGPNYKGRSAADQVGMWYVGKTGDLEATDLAGNGTVRQYLDRFIAPAYAGLGVPYNQGAAGARRAGGGATGDLLAVTGGRGAIMQEFGSTDYAEANPGVYSFATSMGLRSGQHSGIDIGVPRGTQLFSPVAGTVIIAGNSGFYTDNAGGPGELRIRLDNGDELILGHDSAINVRVGQRVSAGQLVGLSGGSDGDHVHVEYRIRDSSTPSGWRIVDPRSRLRGRQVAAVAPVQRGRPS